LCEFSYGDGARRRKLLTLLLDSFDLMQRLSRQITLSAAWATNYRDVLNHKKRFSFAIASCDVADTRSWLSAMRADKLIYWPCFV
jgi:hypothetical protein